MTAGPARSSSPLSTAAIFSRLNWIDRTPLMGHVEPYRRRLFSQFFDERDDTGRLKYNLGLFGRAKKNWKTADLGLASLYCLVNEPPAGYDSACYILANDVDQARDDLALVKKIVAANDVLLDWLTVKRDIIERKDARGFLQILPAQDVAGSHGKSYRFIGYDEIHAYRSWDIFEAMQPDPHRPDAQQWVTSYASLFHRPGVPLFDLFKAGKTATDPRMLFDWWAADFCTSVDAARLSPEERANPSMASWGTLDYLAQQQRRLPAHKYRRLHLNLPGLPEGSAFQPEPVMDAIARGIPVRPYVIGLTYVAFVDMSGGSSDDAVLGIGHRDADGRAALDLLIDQGQRPPFDPNKTVERFVDVLREYRVSRVVGDRYAGLTFRSQFTEKGIAYDVAEQTKSQLYEALEPLLNGHRAMLLDVPTLEQQLLGLVWRGGKIDHQPGEHDDYANAAAGAATLAMSGRHAVNRELIAWCLAAGDEPDLLAKPPAEW